MTRRHALFLFIVFALCLILARGVTLPTTAKVHSQTVRTQQAAHVGLKDAWSRPASGTGVVYLTIFNHRVNPIELVGARTPVASSVEFHRSSTVNSGMGGMMAQMPGMTMKQVTSILIAPGTSLAFEPGDYHLMLVGLRHKLKLGDRFPLYLTFRGAGTIMTTASVQVR